MSDFILPKTQKKPSSDEESIKRRRDELENAQKEVYALRITLNDRQEGTLTPSPPPTFLFEVKSPKRLHVPG